MLMFYVSKRLGCLNVAKHLIYQDIKCLSKGDQKAIVVGLLFWLEKVLKLFVK